MYVDETERHIRSLDPVVGEKAFTLVAAARRAGIPLVITSGSRNQFEQFWLWTKGRFRPGDRITNTILQSRHLNGRAFDVLVLGIHPDRAVRLYAAIGRAGERLGLSWGGRWRSLVDRMHFEG